MMDKSIIEQEKNEMILESIPLFEQRDIGKERTDFQFVQEDFDDHSILYLTVLVDGEEFLKKSRKIEQLNG